MLDSVKIFLADRPVTQARSTQGSKDNNKMEVDELTKDMLKDLHAFYSSKGKGKSSYKGHQGGRWNAPYQPQSSTKGGWNYQPYKGGGLNKADHTKGSSKGDQRKGGKSKGKGKGGKGPCWGCGDYGHQMRDCPRSKTVWNYEKGT